MSTIKNMIAGFGGALTLNIIHESLKRFGGNMPRVDLVGEEALQKALNYAGTEIKDDDALYAATLAGDLVSNAMAYSAIGAADRDLLWPTAIGVGLSTGMAAVELPEQMGLDSAPVARTLQTKALTVGFYLAGALATALILKALDKKM